MTFLQRLRRINLSKSKVSIILFLGITMSFFLPGTAFAEAPTKLLSFYVGQTQPGIGDEQLDWTGTGVPSDSYNVWQSTDGVTWTKLNSTPVTTNTYTTTVEEWVNYFFVVTTSSVTDFPTGVDDTNSTNMSKAFPPNVNKHEYYTSSTDLCAECHETHNAKGPGLLKEQNVTDMCLFCHDGSGSKYNVPDGITTGPNPGDPLSPIIYTTPAGPIGEITVSENKTWSSGAMVTSRHPMGMSLSSAPGGDRNASNEVWNSQMSCASCHQPHNPSNYRLLRSNLPDATGVTVSAFAKTDVANNQETVRYLDGMNNFCSGCHADYLVGAGSGHTASTANANGKPFYSTTLGDHRHAVGVAPADFSLFTGYGAKALNTELPLEGPYLPSSPDYNKNKIMCVTCHTSHGSTVSWQSSSGDPYNLNDSYLMRQAPYNTGNPNVDLCQNCHNLDPSLGK
jgi:predicted CXXCH cytochrome family protein